MVKRKGSKKRKANSNFLKAGEEWRAHLNEYRKAHPNMSLKQQMKGAKKTYKKSKSKSKDVHVSTSKYSVHVRNKRSKKVGKKSRNKSRKKSRKRTGKLFGLF